MDIKNLKVNVKRLIAGLGATFILVSSGGCAEKSTCEIEKPHLHRYEKAGIVRYLIDEDLKVDGFDWTDRIKYVSPQDLEEYQFAQKKNLIRTEDNLSYLSTYEKENDRVLEYEYKDAEVKPIPHVIPNGKTTRTIIVNELVPVLKWTTDSSHEKLTGRVRERSTQYIGYKITSNGSELKVTKSDPANSLLDIMAEYPYFTENSFKTAYNYNVQLAATNSISK